jgi:hypothetical protein
MEKGEEIGVKSWLGAPHIPVQSFPFKEAHAIPETGLYKLP